MHRSGAHIEPANLGSAPTQVTILDPVDTETLFLQDRRS